MNNFGSLLGLLPLICLTLLACSKAPADSKAIVHDAEYYILEAQNGKAWAAEDRELDKKLAALREKYGTPPNIIHVMWDDTSYGDVGIPQISKIRGFETPNINRMANEGMMFTRMYAEIGCTPRLAAHRVVRPYSQDATRCAPGCT